MYTDNSRQGGRLDQICRKENTRKSLEILGFVNYWLIIVLSRFSSFSIFLNKYNFSSYVFLHNWLCGLLFTHIQYLSAIL